MHLFLLATVLAAGSAPTTTDDEAKAAFKAGTAAYDAGNYDAAAKDFLLAYQLSKRGELLFAIALTYRDLGRWADARDYYERYLAEVPSGKSRDLATQQLAEVQQKLAAAEAAAPPPMVEPVPKTEPLATSTQAEVVHHPRTTAIVLGSIGVAATVLAVVAIIEATSFQGYQSHPAGTVLQVSQVQSNVDTANTWATVALVSGIVAVGGVGGSILTW
jgi:tetratricopeptide (TPR) repeat protein